MNKGEIINKNLHRLARIGLEAITSHHDVHVGIGKISCLVHEYKKNKRDIPYEKLDYILEAIKMMEWNLDEMIRIKYQKEQKSEWVSLAEYAQKVRNYFKEYNDISVDIKKDCKVFMPKVALLQTIINLLDNAICFAREEDDYKSPAICRITVDGNKLTMSDAGKGISDEIKDHIFDFCFSDKKSKWSKDDTGLSTETKGLGLYTVKQHSEAFNFDISIKNNTILKGANVTLTFKNFKHE